MLNKVSEYKYNLTKVRDLENEPEFVWLIFVKPLAPITVGFTKIGVKKLCLFFKSPNWEVKLSSEITSVPMYKFYPKELN